MSDFKFEVTSDFDYVSEETFVDQINFTRADEDMHEGPAVCAILVFKDGCLYDSQKGIDLDTTSPIRSNTTCLQEGVYSYNGSLSEEEVIELLTEKGYNVE